MVEHAGIVGTHCISKVTLLQRIYNIISAGMVVHIRALLAGIVSDLLVAHPYAQFTGEIRTYVKSALSTSTRFL